MWCFISNTSNQLLPAEAPVKSYVGGSIKYSEFPLIGWQRRNKMFCHWLESSGGTLVMFTPVVGWGCRPCCFYNIECLLQSDMTTAATPTLGKAGEVNIFKCWLHFVMQLHTMPSARRVIHLPTPVDIRNKQLTRRIESKKSYFYYNSRGLKLP